RWHYLDPMQHLCLFSANALRRACGEVGLSVGRVGRFGRSYTLGYLWYRMGYCYAPRSLRWAADLGRRLPGAIRDASIPVRLGDIVAIEAIRDRAAQTRA